MTDQAWSLHPGDRSENLIQLLPKSYQGLAK